MILRDKLNCFICNYSYGGEEKALKVLLADTEISIDEIKELQ